MSAAKKIFSLLRRKKTLALQDLAGGLGLNRSFFKSARGARILVYHGVCLSHPTRFNSLFITAKTFECHLRFYKKYFAVISMDDYYRQQFIPGRFNVCLSFDDGFANNHDYILPLLNKYKVPAHFFVTAIRETGAGILWNDFLCQQQHFGPPEFSLEGRTYRRNRQLKYVDIQSGLPLAYVLRRKDFEPKTKMMKTLSASYDPEKQFAFAEFWQQLTEAQMRRLAESSYVGFGAHGYYHNDLVMLDPVQLTEELQRSKAYLEKITGKVIRSIAFPYGSYSGSVIRAAKAVGFDQLLAVDFNDVEDALESALRERFTVNPFISVNNQMIAIIKKKYA